MSSKNNSSNVEAEDASSCQADLTSCCASCGIAENDDVKLKKCNGCHLVRYCGVECQKDHRPQHKRACKKRAAELRDELLFMQPDSSHLGDCPICLLPLSLDRSKNNVMLQCCSKVICNGCEYANYKREVEMGLDLKCPFCRKPVPESEAECDRNMMKRAEANDPDALREVGTKRREEGDYKGAFEYWTKAAELGNVSAHYDLSVMYQLGAGVEKDKKKEIYFLERATIGGHPIARCNLGCYELNAGNYRESSKALYHRCQPWT